MLIIMLQVIGSILMLTGIIFFVLGAIGLLRFPDFYTRVHAVGLVDTLGATLVILGLVLVTKFNMVTVKLGFILVFILITSPVSGHALVNSAWRLGLKPLEIKKNKK